MSTTVAPSDRHLESCEVICLPNGPSYIILLPAKLLIACKAAAADMSKFLSDADMQNSIQLSHIQLLCLS